MFGKYEDLVEKASEMGLKAYFLDAKNIPIENRTALKCAYGCKGYGTRLSCPPYVTVLHQLDQKIIYPHYDFKRLTEKYFEIGMKLNDFSIQLVKYCMKKPFWIYSRVFLDLSLNHYFSGS